MGLGSAAGSEAVWVECFGYCDGGGNGRLGGLRYGKHGRRAAIFHFSVLGAGLRSMG